MPERAVPEQRDTRPENSGSSGSERIPVLVVGGGPAGLSLALELSMHGVGVTVVEPRLNVDHQRPRAKTTSPRTMEFFRRWNVASRVRAAAALPVSWSDRITFCTSVTGPEVTAFTGVFGLDLTGSPLVAEAGQQVTQPVIEQVLRDAAEESKSVTLLLGQRVVDVQMERDGASVTTEDLEGTRRVIQADYLVGADGPRSIVRTAIGARYEGSDTGRPNVNITFRTPGLARLIPHPPSVHYWVLNPDAPGVVGALDLDDMWWAIATGAESITDEHEAAALVRRLVGQESLEVEVIATDPWQARMLLADKYRAGRAFLIGDAAHQNPPWGGHGFNTGVGDAMNLGWKLAAVVNGWAPETLLDSYETERRPVAQATIDVAVDNTRTLSVDLADPGLMSTGQTFQISRERVAAAIQQNKDAEFHSLGLVLGTGYGPDSHLQAPDSGTYIPLIAAGNRLPHRWLRDGTSLYDALGPEMTVIGRAADTVHLLGAARDQAVPVTWIDSDPDLNVPAVAVVRPDQVIAWAGAAPAPEDAPEIVRQALRGFTTQMAAVNP